MGVSEGAAAKYKFALVQTSQFKQPTFIADGGCSCYKFSDILIFHLLTDDVVYDHKWLPDDALGLDHIDKTGRAGRAGGNERAIVIKG